MSDVFLSYVRHDEEITKHLVRVLEDAGWEVWFDANIRAGTKWPTVLRTQIEATRCLVVLISLSSLQSTWVQEEMLYARQIGRMILPVKIEDVDNPFGFLGLQTVSMVGWRGGSDQRLDILIAALAKVCLPRPDFKIHLQNATTEFGKVENTPFALASGVANRLPDLPWDESDQPVATPSLGSDDARTFLAELGKLFLMGLLLLLLLFAGLGAWIDTTKKHDDIGAALVCSVLSLLVFYLFTRRLVRQVVRLYKYVVLAFARDRFYRNYRLAERASRTKLFGEAIREYDVAIKSNDAFADAFAGRGFAYYAIGDEAKCLKNLRLAADKGSRRWDIYLHLGRCLYDEHDYDGSVKLFTHALTLCRPVWWQHDATVMKECAVLIHESRALAFLQLRRYDQAIVDYTKAIKYMPTAQRYLARSQARRTAGDTAGAEDDLDVSTSLTASTNPPAPYSGSTPWTSGYHYPR